MIIISVGLQIRQNEPRLEHPQRRVAFPYHNTNLQSSYYLNKK